MQSHCIVFFFKSKVHTKNSLDIIWAFRPLMGGKGDGVLIHMLSVSHTPANKASC